MNVPRIADHVIPCVFEHLKRHQSIFFDEQLLSKLSSCFLHPILCAFPDVTNHTTSLYEIIRRILLHNKTNIPKNVRLFLAYIIPALIELMPSATILQIIHDGDWQSVLDNHDYQWLSNRDYFDVRFDSSSDDEVIPTTADGILYFKAINSHNRLYFCGREWWFAHAHIHFGNGHNGHELVFQPTTDPMGIIDIIFRHTKENDKGITIVRLLLEIGETNPMVSDLLCKLNFLSDNTSTFELKQKINLKNIFLSSIKRDKLSHFEYAYQRSGKITSQLSGLEGGARIISLPEPIIISLQQYESLSNFVSQGKIISTQGD